jgi:autotransporter-associated beta strand protein
MNANPAMAGTAPVAREIRFLASSNSIFNGASVMRYSRHRILAATSFLFVFLLTSGIAFGQSAIVVPSPGYSANDVFLDRAPETFGAFGSNLACFEKSSGLEIANPATGSVAYSLGLPNDNYIADNTANGVWSSFIAADPSGTSLWVGFTIFGNGDDRIYQVDLGGNWVQKATLPGNYDMQFSGTNAYLTANDAGLGAGNSAIWQFTPASSQLDEVAFVGGYSVGLGADSQGNVYYGTYGFTPGNQSLYRFGAADIAAAVSTQTPLTIANATKLADFAAEYGPSDIDVDAAGNVVFDLNPGYNVAVWNGTAGNGANYDVIAHCEGSSHWMGIVETYGDVRNGDGTVYIQDYYSPGIAQLIRTANSWTGGSGTNSYWTTPTNWSTGVAPQSGNVLCFAGSTAATPENDFSAGTVFGGIRWLSDTAPMTLTGNAIDLTGGVSNESGNPQTIALPIQLVGTNNHVFDAALGDIEVQSPITESSAESVITKRGGGKLVFSAQNTYTGDTNIQAGTIVLTTGGDISTASLIHISAGASLEIESGSHMVGIIDGNGSTFVDAGASLTALAIVQDSLIIGSPSAAAVPEPGMLLLLSTFAGVLFICKRFSRG